MKLGRSLFLSFTLLVATMVAPGACGTDGLVGGTCKSGYAYCNGRCLNIESDALNCGRCGNRCESDVACINGYCGGGGEGWGGFGGDGYSGSGNHGQYAGNAGISNDAGDGGSGGFNEFDVIYPQGGSGPDICTPPYDTAEQCGSCANACVEPTPVCADVGNKNYKCQIQCEAPLVNCSNACVDLNSDSDNCGRCGKACPSGICQGGACVGAQAGHIVNICMNFREVAQYSQPTTLLGNAVFLSMESPVKILAYSQYADSAVTTRVNAVIDWAARARGRSYQIATITDPDLVNRQLKKPDFDVFLVYDQKDAPTGTLGAYGTQWNKTLESFSYVGGVIVALDGNTGVKEMPELLTNASLLSTSGHSGVSRTQVYNISPGNVIGANVVSPFMAPRDSCVFTTTLAAGDTTTTWVIADKLANSVGLRPLAVHRIAIPPTQ